MATFTCQRVSSLCCMFYKESSSASARILLSVDRLCTRNSQMKSHHILAQSRHALTQLTSKSHPNHSLHLSRPHTLHSAYQRQNALKPLSANAFCRLVNTSTLSDFTEDIDIDQMRKQARKEMKATGKHVVFLDKVKETLARKCQEKMENLDEAEKKKLQVIQLEHSFLYSEGYSIPSTEEMQDVNWLEALSLQSKSQRLKYYVFIKKRMYMKEKEQMKKLEKKASALTREKKEYYEHGRLLMRVYETTMRRWLNYRLAASMCHGLPLVLDMDYVDFMRPLEQRNTAHQLHDVYCLNRADEQEPFHLFFTGCAEENPVNRLMQIRLQDNPHFMATVTPKSYIDLFDKQDLVYLSPHSGRVMTKFDPNAVYVIGAFNDKATQKPISYARAMEQGLKCQRLPLDEHLNWSQGNKALTLDQMIKIMMALKNGQSWQEAFQHIPRRKLKYEDDSS